MTSQIINGKEIAEKVRNEVKKKVSSLEKKPGLAVVLVGEHVASKIYVARKEKACDEIGFYSEKHELPENSSEDDVIAVVQKLNTNDKIHGILVQLPLPKQINEQRILNWINPRKDVDGFHPLNMGNLIIGNNKIVACTPKGIIKLIESTKQKIEGKHAVIIGRSNIVGKPLALLLLQKNATVTMCHSKTENLAEITKQADILIAAVGKSKFVTKEMVKEGAIVIDVGMNRVEDKLFGDVDFDAVKEVCGFITPVPGGVGPMTIACLLENTLEAYERLE